MQRVQLASALAILALIAAPAGMSRTLPNADQAALSQAVAGAHRVATNVVRDKYRHPKETLLFFGVKPTDRVVEIWPGGGWYTEILAPYLAEKGKLTVAPPSGKGADRIAQKLVSEPAIYGKVQRANFPAALGGTAVPPGTADVVLTFRNVHNWTTGYGAPGDKPYGEEAFREIYAMLKPGGTLGIEDHRLPENASAERERDSGYLKVSTVRALAEKAGFKFAGASQINANARDTHDYPGGVWTLPPTYGEGDKDRARYAAIGESDRMTLRFIKPRN
jgi:predicted methyltransferase